MHAFAPLATRPAPPTATPRRCVAAAAVPSRRDVLLAATSVVTPVESRLKETAITLTPGGAATRPPPPCGAPLSEDTATPLAARVAAAATGTLPPAVTDFATVVRRVAASIDDAGDTPGTLARYRAAMAAASATPRAFCALLRSDVTYVADVYTPAVGECRAWGVLIARKRSEILLKKNTTVFPPPLPQPGAACLAWGRLLPRPTCLYLAAGADLDAAVASWPPCDADGDGAALAVTSPMANASWAWATWAPTAPASRSASAPCTRRRAVCPRGGWCQCCWTRAQRRQRCATTLFT